MDKQEPKAKEIQLSCQCTTVTRNETDYLLWPWIPQDDLFCVDCGFHIHTKVIMEKE